MGTQVKGHFFEDEINIPSLSLGKKKKTTTWGQVSMDSGLILLQQPQQVLLLAGKRTESPPLAVSCPVELAQRNPEGKNSESRRQTNTSMQSNPAIKILPNPRLTHHDQSSTDAFYDGR